MAQLKNSDLVNPVDVKASSLIAEWQRFKTEFECYLIINELEEKSNSIKLAYLRLLIGSEAADLIQALGLSTEDQKNFTKVIDGYEKYFSPNIHFFIKRMKFYQRSQEESESFDQFVAEVRKLAYGCEFKDQDEQIRDRIVIGMKNKKLKERIIFLDDFSLNTVINKVRLFEMQKNELMKLNADKNPKIDKVIEKSSKIYKRIKTSSNDFKPTSSKSVKEKQFERSVGCKEGGKVDAMDKDNCSKEDLSVNSEVVRYVSSLAWYKNLKISDKMIRFKLDTGAQINTITEELVSKFKHDFKIIPSKVKLQAYSGGMIKPTGKVILPIVMKNKIYHEEFEVLKGDFEPLLGLKSCINMNLISRIDAIDINKHSHNEAENAKFLEYYKDVFEGLGKFDKSFKLHLQDKAIPFAAAPRRIPLKLKDKVLNKLNEMEKLGVISKVNEPREWINNIVIVEKGEKIRICIDPKHLNNALKNFRYPIPSLDELKQDLIDAKYFSVLDLKDGFWHVELDEDSKKLCSFSTPYGMYQFNRLPFGIKIASETFQKYMFDTFGDLKGVKFYIDDIIIFGKDLKEHDLNVKAVMLRAREKGIKFNLKKVQLTQESVKFFGHIFSKNLVSIDPARIEVISDIPAPSNKNDVQKFLGIINYMRNFIPHMPKLTHNIRNLLKKDSEFVWQAQHQLEFENLKCVIRDSACCASFDEKLPLELETDASSYGLGACLKQGDKIICYASRCLSDIEKEYGQIEKEFLAVYFGCKKFHDYVYGRRVIVKSDHKPLESIMLKDLTKIGSRRLQRLRLKLYKYDLHLDYKPGNKIPIADYLSRYTSQGVEKDFEENIMKEMVHTLSISDEKLNLYQSETSKDSELKILIDYYNKGWPSDKSKVPDYVKCYYKMRSEIYVSQGLVFYEDRLIVPKSLRQKILADLHEGHMGMTKTLKFAKESLYWPSMAQSIENLVSSCDLCNKYAKSNKKEPIIQHEIPPRAFEKVGCDVLELCGKSYLVLVDYFSKWICCKYLSSKNSSMIISKWIEIFAEHGVPREIIADNMPFNSNECRAFANEWDILITTSSPHYPQSNDLAEKAVGIVKNMMKKTKNSDQLCVALMNYNNTPLGDLDLSPSQLSQNRRMRTKLVTKTESLEPRLNKNLEERFRKKNFKSKFYYNRNVAKHRDFAVGDHVWLQNQIGTWTDGKIISKLNQPRSYEILLSNGSVLRRNSKFLRLNKSSKVADFNDSDSVSSFELDDSIFFNTLHPPQVPNATATIPQQSIVDQNASNPPQQSIVDQNAVNPPQLRRSSRIPKPTKKYGQT